MVEKECTHNIRVEGHWVENPSYDFEEDMLGGYGGEAMDWVPSHDKPTVVDINLHQYKCTQCGKVFSY